MLAFFLYILDISFKISAPAKSSQGRGNRAASIGRGKKAQESGYSGSSQTHKAAVPACIPAHQKYNLGYAAAQATKPGLCRKRCGHWAILEHCNSLPIKGVSTGLLKCWENSLHPEKERTWITAEDRNENSFSPSLIQTNKQTNKPERPPQETIPFPKSQIHLSDGYILNYICHWPLLLLTAQVPQECDTW